MSKVKFTKNNNLLGFQVGGRGESPKESFQKSEQKFDNTFTKFCEYSLEQKECYRKGCTFAHNIEQLRLRPCGYGDSCNRRKGKCPESRICKFFHPSDDKLDYCQINDLIIPKPIEITTRLVLDLKDSDSEGEEIEIKSVSSLVEREKLREDIIQGIENVELEAFEKLDIISSKEKEKEVMRRKQVEKPKTTFYRVPKELYDMCKMVATTKGEEFEIEIV